MESIINLNVSMFTQENKTNEYLKRGQKFLTNRNLINIMVTFNDARRFLWQKFI